VQAIPAHCSARANGDAKARRYTGFHACLDTCGSYACLGTCGSHACFDPRGIDSRGGNPGGIAPSGIDASGIDASGIDSRSERNVRCARGWLRSSRTKGPCCDCRWR
jgi:hypothetical protein